MAFKVIQKLPTRSSNSALVVAVSTGNNLPDFDLPEETLSAVRIALKRGDLEDSANATLALHDVPGITIPRLLLVRVAPFRKDRPASSVILLAQGIKKALSGTSCSNVILALDETLCAPPFPIPEFVQLITTAFIAEHYQFKALLKKQKSVTKPPTLTFLAGKEHSTAVKRAAKQGAAFAAGMALTQDLGNTAPNVCTPSYLADQARALAKSHSATKVTVLDEARMKRLGMGAFLSVSQGSRQPGCLIAMDYRGGAKTQAPIVLVGKGVTFDTGGISIKPSAGMDEMKYDMCGAATVFGVIKACQALDLKLNVVGVVAAAENMPDGDASRPGDVVTTLSGQTVEILNTDAEGRLVLCDTLTWVEKYKPKAVVDIATLTGACIVALGNVCSAVLGNDEDLIDALRKSGQSTADTTWPLPLWDDYQTQLDSKFADMANIGGSGGGTITAACFLSRFTTNYPWAHLDIAGVAWNSGANKGATGRPVPMLMHWLLSQT